jgi:hypothetical protein
LEIVEHKEGAFLWDQIVSVDLVPLLSQENVCFTVTLKNGKSYQFRKCDYGYTMERFIEQWKLNKKETTYESTDSR